MNWLAVALGGSIGALARFGAFQVWKRFIPSIPMFWATLMVNVIGCLLIGYLFAYVTAKSTSESFKLFWMVGVLGGFTTFSAFGLDIFQMMQSKGWMFTSGYFLLHGIVCVLMVFVGSSCFTQ